MVRAFTAALAGWACATSLVGAPQAGAVQDPDRMPTSIAALGDSITRGFNACGFYRDCPRRSWSTGAAGEVDSHRTRLEQRGAVLQQANLAKSGARSDALAGQAARAVEAGADYVTIEIGANDACTRSPDDMTSVEDFRRNIQAGLAVLRERAPDARVFIASIPDLNRLWSVGHTSWYIRKVWAELDICQSMLARSNSQDYVDVMRRGRVRTRTIDFNNVLAQLCDEFGPNCRFDQKAVFRTTFTRAQLSHWDFFHPSAEGQRLLADITWRNGFFGSDAN
jgi:lysophospholipase L1-like esterase